MKKIFALVLAVAMLCTVAFAAAETKAPGAKISLNTETAFTWTAELEDDDTLYIKSYTFKKGKDLVEKVALKSDGSALEITLKKDPMATASKVNLAVEAEKIVLGVKGSANTGKLTAGFEYIVTNEYNDKFAKGAEPGDEVWATADAIDYVYKIDKDVAYVTLKLATADGFEVAGRAYAKDTFNFANDATLDNAVWIALADTEVDVTSVVNFKNAPTFKGKATITFYGVDEDAAIYEVVDKKIVASDAKYDATTGIWSLKTAKLGTYFVTDEALPASVVGGAPAVDTPAVDTPATNPATGANDVVGVATALAVVSLVAAAAVSLKK